MRRLLISIFVLALCVGQSSAQLNVWRWQNPLPVGDMLLGVQMFSLNNTYACGENGTFIRTSDGGLTWDLQTNVLKFKTEFTGLSFSSPTYGMCCGDSGRIIKTTDGGNSWKPLQSGIQTKLNGIVVINTNIALVVTRGGGIIKTTNGGARWDPVAFENSFALYTIRMLRPDFLYVTGYSGILLKSIDTGRTWQNISTPYGNTYFSAGFTNDSNAVVIGDNALLISTTNAGGIWNRINLDSNAVTASLNCVDGKDPKILAIVGDYGTMLNTTDGGKSWSRFYLGTNEHIKSVSFFDKLNATAVGRDGGILRTTDGGASWVFQPQFPELLTLNSVAFPRGDTSLGLGVGQLGTIKRTTNGGKLWTLIPSGTTHRLRSVTFIDSIDAIAVGDYGTIIKSTDGGLTWSPQQSETKQNLYSVSFATPTDGLVVGDSNTCLKTYSAGEFWTIEFVNTPPHRLRQDMDYFRSVSYPDKKYAFISGFHTYYYSEDGGINWKYRWIDPAQDTTIFFQPGFSVDTISTATSTLISISFVDSLHGAITRAYDNGPGPQNKFWFVHFTSDGGTTWDSIRTPNNVPLNHIQCVDKMHATVVGNGGYIGHSSDGGKTIIEQTSNTLNNLYGICFGNLSAGTAVGSRGNIIRITTDELFPSSVKNTSNEAKLLIEAIYPNPCTDFSTIQYSLPSSGFVTIEMYSVKGVLVASLFPEFKSEGLYRIRFDATGLATGTYIVRISSGGQTTTKEMIIMR